jgi:N-acyl-D-aspartate/D-glutamate deacylase/CubicO group peptidase (beta-lactamase class C family)
MKKLIVCLLVLWPFIVSAQSTEQKITRIDSILTYLHERQLFNGTVLIGEKGKVLYKKAFGIANGQTQEKLTTLSSFNLASVSKQFYAMMVMLLKEQGKLHYEDPVQKYLPIFPYPLITIRHLMNQTSGLPEYFDIALNGMNLLDTLTNQSMLELLAYKKIPLSFQPGEKWEYCNTNYTTLASVVEKVSGMSPDVFFQKYIAVPLKMKDSYIYHLKMKSHPKSRVFGFHWESDKNILDDLVRVDGIVGDGNVYSSVEDLYKWDQALYTDRLVKQSTFKEAITPGKLLNGEATQYGFGWGIEQVGKTVLHTGGWAAFRTIIIRYIDKNQSIILLDNSGNSQAHQLIKNAWEGKPYSVPQTFLISNVLLIDGTGLPAYQASVRIQNNRIQGVGNLRKFPNEEAIDGKGMVLAPGFIDSHSHHDWGLKENPHVIAATNQGITTIVVGQDGGSAPIDSIKALIKAKPISVNIASYTGHSTLRREVMKQRLFQVARKAEVDSMKSILAKELDKGSLGLATGLEYESAFYSNREEVIELAKVAAEKGGRYISHIRSEDINIDEALDEIISIGQDAKIPVQISHFKIAMRSKWGNSRKYLAALLAARAQGINVTADVYPYSMWSSTPRVLFPKKDFENLKSAEFATQELFDPSASVMTHYPPNAKYEGKTISEIASLNNESVASGLLRVIRETSAPGMSGSIVATSMSEEDIQNFLKWDYSVICSDGAMEGHPRGFGAFPRFLGKYVRDLKLMPLETAVRKMTSQTAEQLGIKQRGLIAPGYFADLVLFDPVTVLDNATITNHAALSTGIEMVWVNGKLVYQKQKSVANYPGVFVAR